MMTDSGNIWMVVSLIGKNQSKYFCFWKTSARGKNNSDHILLLFLFFYQQTRVPFQLWGESVVQTDLNFEMPILKFRVKHA